jgi:hypothetical protein
LKKLKQQKMKTKLLITAILFSTFGFSQNREKGTIELTPTIGYASANYYGENVINNDAISSVTFGVNGDYFFNDRWSLRTALAYQTMGTQFSSYKEELKYLTIPVNANWHFGSTRKWNLNFGPSIGFIMSAKNNQGGEFKELINPTQFGFNFGIGYKIEINDDFSILIDHQEMIGLNKIGKNSDSYVGNVFGSFNVGAVIKL